MLECSLESTYNYVLLKPVIDFLFSVGSFIHQTSTFLVAYLAQQLTVTKTLSLQIKPTSFVQQIVSWKQRNAAMVQMSEVCLSLLYLQRHVLDLSVCCCSCLPTQKVRKQKPCIKIREARLLYNTELPSCKEVLCIFDWESLSGLAHVYSAVYAEQPDVSVVLQFCACVSRMASLCAYGWVGLCFADWGCVGNDN